MAKPKGDTTKADDTGKMKFNPDSKSGRIGRLDEHTLGYYRRVSDTLKDGFESQEEKGKLQLLLLSLSRRTHVLVCSIH